MDVGASQENQELISSTTGAKVNFCEVESVAKLWMIDFNFLLLCRYYKEQNAEKFSKTLKVFEGKPSVFVVVFASVAPPASCAVIGQML